MRTILQWGLIATFVCLALFVFIPSFAVLTATPPSVSRPPEPPAPPREDKFDDATVNAYTQKVAAYKAAVIAYSAQMQAVQKSDQIAAYQLVVKETLATVFGATLASLMAFAFISAVAQVRDNHNRMRNNREPQEISFFN